jgi:hypothetical protein
VAATARRRFPSGPTSCVSFTVFPAPRLDRAQLPSARGQWRATRWVAVCLELRTAHIRPAGRRHMRFLSRSGRSEGRSTTVPALVFGRPGASSARSRLLTATVTLGRP